MKDMIYRADAIEEVCRDCTMELYGKEECEVYKNGNCGSVNAISALPSAEAVDVAHDIPEYCSWSQTYTNMVQSAMSNASAEAVQIKQTDTLIIADALRYLAQDEERHELDRERTEALREQILQYGASMCHAEAVQGWIPCSERLPSESGDYLCTIPLDEVDTYTEVLTFHKGNFYEVDDEWGTIYYDDVIAWMPLPTPYKGGDDE